MYTNNHEILIHALQVTNNHEIGDCYEFVLNEHLQVVECIKIDALTQEIICQIKDLAAELEGKLFELSHVRINPIKDNTHIINCLVKALQKIDVQVLNKPSEDSIAICFKPLGEISDNVRFYLSYNDKIVFLSPANKLKLIKVNKNQ